MMNEKKQAEKIIFKKGIGYGTDSYRKDGD